MLASPCLLYRWQCRAARSVPRARGLATAAWRLPRKGEERWKKLPARRKNVPARQPLEAIHVVERMTVAAQPCAEHLPCLGGMDDAVAAEAEREEDAVRTLWPAADERQPVGRGRVMTRPGVSGPDSLAEQLRIATHQ